MFTQISWSNYITVVALLLAGYYLIIGYLYYRSDILNLLLGRKIIQFGNTSLTATQTDPLHKPVLRFNKAHVENAFEKQNLFPAVQSLSDEIQAFLNEAGRNKLNKEDVLPPLQLLLAKYPILKDSSFQESMQNIIETECIANCSIHLSEEDLNKLWK